MSGFGIQATLIDVQLPRTGRRAKMRLLTRSESFTLKIELRRFFVDAGMPLDAGSISSIGLIEEYNNETAVRHLAIAVRDPDDPAKALHSLDAWRDGADEELIKAMWSRYLDLEAELDPNSDNDGGLNDGDLAALDDAAKKKNVAILRSYGSRTLATYSTILAERLSTSAPAS